MNKTIIQLVGMSVLTVGIAQAQFNADVLHPKPALSSSTEVQTKVVDLNQANAEQLMSLEGIGAKKAEAILAYRQAHGAFKSINELAGVKGFSEKTLATLIKKNGSRMSVQATS